MKNVKPGMPVTVHYTKAGDQMVATKIVVKKVGDSDDDYELAQSRSSRAASRAPYVKITSAPALFSDSRLSSRQRS